MTEHFSIKKYAMAIIPGIFLPQCQYKFDINLAAAKKQLFFPPSEVEQSLQMCEYWIEYNLQQKVICNCIFISTILLLI